MPGAKLIFISHRRATKADVGNVKNWKGWEIYNFFSFFFLMVPFAFRTTQMTGPGHKSVAKATGRQMGTEAGDGREWKLLLACCRPPMRLNANNLGPGCSVPLIHMPLISAEVRQISSFIWAECKSLGYTSLFVEGGWKHCPAMPRHWG